MVKKRKGHGTNRIGIHHNHSYLRTLPCSVLNHGDVNMITIKHSQDELGQYCWAQDMMVADICYAIGWEPPHYPVPSIMQGSYVLAGAVAEDESLLVAWCADGSVIAW